MDTERIAKLVARVRYEQDTVDYYPRRAFERDKMALEYHLLRARELASFIDAPNKKRNRLGELIGACQILANELPLAKDK